MLLLLSLLGPAAALAPPTAAKKPVYPVRSSSVRFWAFDLSCGAGALSSPVREEHPRDAAEFAVWGEAKFARVCTWSPRWLLLSALGISLDDLATILPERHHQDALRGLADRTNDRVDQGQGIVDDVQTRREAAEFARKVLTVSETDKEMRESLFEKMREEFGFQEDSVNNQKEHLDSLLLSCASRCMRDL